MELPWWIDVVLLSLAVFLWFKAAGLMRENRKLKDIIRHLEGWNRKESEPEEKGQGGAEGES
jgi:hypothetical protein